MSDLKVLVGVDGSTGASHALRWAAQHATSAGGKLVAVMAWEYPYTTMFPAPVGISVPPTGAMSEATETSLTKAVAEARNEYDIEIETVVCEGTPARVILDRADIIDADLIVVGTQGRGTLAQMMMGSVSRNVVTHTHRPTVVVPEGAPLTHSGTVLVGVDESENSVAALRWALQLDAHRIDVVHTWTVPSAYAVEAVTFPAADLELRAQGVLDRALAESGAGADDRVHAALVHGDARSTLHDSGADPRLIVIGSRGHTGISGALLGSVATYLATHASVATAVIPHDPT